MYVAVRALINLNERFIDAVSNPAGIIGLFFGLLTVFAILFRFFIYRRLRKETAAFEQAVSELVRKRLVRTVLIFTESSDQLSRATDRVPGLPASPG
ncbi:GIY-YIG nuclease family protein, partial [Escherichia coli]